MAASDVLFTYDLFKIYRPVKWMCNLDPTGKIQTKINDTYD